MGEKTGEKRIAPIGLVLAAALLAGFGTGATAAHAEDAFAAPKIVLPAEVRPSRIETRYFTGDVTFNGPGGLDYYYSFHLDGQHPSVKLVSKNTRVRAAYVRSKPVLETSLNPRPGVENKVSLRVSMLATPGRYRVRVPVTQQRNADPQTAVTRTGTRDVIVRANLGRSRESTYATGSAAPRKTFPMTVYAPYYQAGAKVRVYFKAKGASKYRKVATGTLRVSNAQHSRAKIKISKRYDLGAGGSVYLRVGKAPYAGAYKSLPQRIERD